MQEANLPESVKSIIQFNAWLNNWLDKELEKDKEDLTERQKKEKTKQLIKDLTLTPEHIINEGYFTDGTH